MRRSQSASTIPSWSYSGPAITSPLEGSITTAPPWPNTSLSAGNGTGKSSGKADAAIEERPRHIDRIAPEPLPEVIPATETRRRPPPRVRWKQRDKALRQHRELRPPVGRLMQQPLGLLHAALGIEDHRRGLNRRDPHGRKVHHAHFLGL